MQIQKIKEDASNEGINRYIMECKYGFNALAESMDRGELIDTLWNVNSRKTK